MPVFVNEFEITDDEVFSEMQHHPAEDMPKARDAAAQALVIRRLLINESIKLGMLKEPITPKKEETAIVKLLDKSVTSPPPGKDVCETYFNNNRKKFPKENKFEDEHKKIQHYLVEQSFRQGFRSFILRLANKNKIIGVDLT